MKVTPCGRAGERGVQSWGAEGGAEGGGMAQRRGRCCAGAKDVLVSS